MKRELINHPKPFKGYHISANYRRLDIYHFGCTGLRFMVSTETPNKGLSLDERREIIDATLREHGFIE